MKIRSIECPHCEKLVEVGEDNVCTVCDRFIEQPQQKSNVHTPEKKSLRDTDFTLKLPTTETINDKLPKSLQEATQLDSGKGESSPFKCKHCQELLTVAADHEGRVIKCDHCGKINAIPNPGKRSAVPATKESVVNQHQNHPPASEAEVDRYDPWYHYPVPYGRIFLMFCACGYSFLVGVFELYCSYLGEYPKYYPIPTTFTQVFYIPYTLIVLAALVCLFIRREVTLYLLYASILMALVMGLWEGYHLSLKMPHPGPTFLITFLLICIFEGIEIAIVRSVTPYYSQRSASMIEVSCDMCNGRQTISRKAMNDPMMCVHCKQMTQPMYL